VRQVIAKPILMLPIEKSSCSPPAGFSERSFAAGCTEMRLLEMEPLSQVLAEIRAALDRVGIRYAVGGSVAFSARGVWHSTLDVGLVAAIRPGQAHDLVAAPVGMRMPK